MTTICPKCGHQRNANDDPAIPSGQCPSCGIYYFKYLKQKNETSNNPISKPPIAQDIHNDHESNRLNPFIKNKNTRKKLIITVVVISIMWLSGRFYLGPSTTMNDFRQALVHGNASDLDEYVDFDKVKINIKSRLKIEMNQRVNALEGNPFAGLAVMVADTAINKLVENIVSPDGLKAIAAKWDKDKVGQETVYFSFNYNGYNHAKIIIDNSSSIEMERIGLFSWKIVDMIFPFKKSNLKS